jgi:hypothetical protein
VVAAKAVIHSDSRANNRHNVRRPLRQRQRHPSKVQLQPPLQLAPRRMRNNAQANVVSAAVVAVAVVVVVAAVVAETMAT